MAPLRRGPGDPTFRVDDGAIWRTSRMDAGPVTARITRLAEQRVQVQAWGAGAADFLGSAPDLLGRHDDWSDFHPAHPLVAQAAAAAPHLRLGRTDRVLEALIPAVLEQRVPGKDAFRAWRTLVTMFGDPAPGPAPPGMRVFPAASTWERIPSWQFHRANVDPGRARTIVTCAHRAKSLERLGAKSVPEAMTALTSLPGIGVWTAAEVVQRAFGAADEVSVGDYHLAKMIGWTLLGHPVDDDTMLELLDPMRPHRQRAVRLLEVSGLARQPRRGPRLSIQDIRGL